MWKCPICSNEEKSEYICQICGYDVRKDFVRNRTIQIVPPQDAKVFAKRISDYDEAERQKAAEAARVLLEVIKREQEKKAEEERRAEAERLAKEAAARKAEEERLAREAAERKAEEERLAREAAERKAEEERLARAAEAARKAAEERQKVQQTYTSNSRRKSSKGLKVAAFCILIGIGGAVAASMFGGSQERENESAYRGVEKAWNQVLAASKESLNTSDIDYENDSLENISAYWESEGYTVTIDPASYNEEYDYMVYNTNGSYNSNYLVCEEIESADAVNRSMSFYCYDLESSMYDSMNEIAPFPYGIKFGDSFDEVYEKLGLTDEMISYGTDLEGSGMVNVYIDHPGDEFVSIGLYFNDYSFSYYFDETTYVLDAYYVDTYKAMNQPSGTENDNVSEVYAENGSWDAIVQTSMDALKNGPVNYIEQSRKEIKEIWEDQGLTVYKDSDIDWRYISVDTSLTDISVYEAYEFAVKKDYRYLDFENLAIYSEEKLENGEENPLNTYVPLPYGITFNDSIEVVCSKLGITEELLTAAYDMENIYVDIIYPEEKTEDQYVRIFIECRNETGETTEWFEYMFLDDGSALNSYNVMIYP